MNEQRLVNIESKIAHQEDLLAELNDALSSQQLQLSNLDVLCHKLVQRVRSLSETGDGVAPDDEKPPHY
jgi:SlyX protein